MSFCSTPYRSATIWLISFFLIVLSAATGYCQSSGNINIIFTSDAHYGITREKFKGATNVDSYIVNAALINAVNSVPAMTLPVDSGINASTQVKAIDYLIEGGDITNRMEYPVQTATVSWSQFKKDYMDDLKLTGSDGKPAKLLMVPGNHDISNAIGFVRPMEPETDPISMVNIYNLMVKPATPLTTKTYNYAKDKVNYTVDVKGIHFMFLNLWPDSAERVWMEKDLEKVPANMPVVIFTHDEPAVEAKHFTNPTPPYLMGEKRKFQNLLEEHYKEGRKAHKGEENTIVEQNGFVAFLKLHPNIKAYFHGNANYNEFYDYKGPENDIDLKSFRVDSPMKGNFSSKDEKQLSFQLLSLDPVSQQLTVRECLWDTVPSSTTPLVVFGKSTTVSLKVN